jgi:PHD/YefM family antitoxin component YafN of YafNO toxin-antitoxin module
MTETKNAQDAPMWTSALIADLSQPIVLERDGQPMAVLMSVEEYEQYQALLAQDKQMLAAEARRAADRVIFGDLVGCALRSDEPIWTPEPKPHWQIPYRFLDGTLLKIVEVDAQTGQVSLTDEERATLLEQVERLATAADVSA